MSARSFLLDDELYAYVAAHNPQPDEIVLDLIAETQALGPVAGMQIGPDQGAFMALITRLVGARRAIEIGTFTGFSSLCLARAMGPKGRLLCCDVSEEWTSIARRYWNRAGVAGNIELRIGPALDTLRTLDPDDRFDLAFIDADKEGYLGYYEELVPRMGGGVIMVDNVLWSGRVAGDDNEPSTVALREFNDHVTADGRVEASLLPIGDGLTLIRVNDDA